MSVGKRSWKSELPAFWGPHGCTEPWLERQVHVFLLLGVLSLPDALAPFPSVWLAGRGLGCPASGTQASALADLISLSPEATSPKVKEEAPLCSCSQQRPQCF